MMQFRFYQILTLISICLFFLLPLKIQAPQPIIQPPLELAPIAPIAILETDQDQAAFVATLSAQAVVAIDVDSAAILLEKEAHLKIFPASTTKMLTALVAREIFALDQVITVNETPANIGHTIGFVQGEEFAFMDMLRALLVNSGNDAAEVLAQNHPQGYKAFIQAMNEKATQLHLQNTAFANPSGLDAAAHYSTAFDLSLIARELMKDELLKIMVSTKQVQIQNLATTRQYYLYNTNLLLGNEPGVVGIKTGTTDLAGEALVTQVNRDDKQIILVVLNSQDRYADTKRMIEWIFSHYQWQNF